MSYVIAIDGPGGAGKSTIAKLVAAKLGIIYVDTGAMYRAAAVFLNRRGIDKDDDKSIEKAVSDIDITFSNERVLLNGEDVSKKIRENDVSKLASEYSENPAVRDKLTALQRQMGKTVSLVMDGRDIGSNVFKDAKYKFYLTASPEIRAERRYNELKERGEHIKLSKILEDIKTRDDRDMNRKLNPLKIVDGAVLIDSTDINIDEVVEKILSNIEER